MITLGIETSGRQGSVALVRDGELLGERDLSREGRRHARTLISELRDLLSTVNPSPAEVNTIAVSIGPGSFTGLRVGVTCAKTWAYATGAALVAVDTFLAVAEQSQPMSDEVHVISDAQRGDLFVGRFRRGVNGRCERHGEIDIAPIDGWVSTLRPNLTVTGPALDKLRDLLANKCQAEAAEAAHPQAATVARIGERMANQGESSDAWTIEPLYLRKSAAEEKAAR